MSPKRVVGCRGGSRSVRWGGIPRYWLSKMYLGYSRSQRFHKLIPRFIQHYQNSCNRYPIFLKIFLICEELLRFHDYPNCFRISKIVLIFHNVDFQFVCSERSFAPFVLDPQKYLKFFDPHHSQAWAVRIVRHPPSQHFILCGMSGITFNITKCWFHVFW